MEVNPVADDLPRIDELDSTGELPATHELPANIESCATDELPDSEDLVGLATAIGARLLAKNWQVTVAESCTGGGAAYVLTSVPGSSAWFEEGFVVYANQVKERRLQVPATLLAAHGAVSEPVVLAMAAGAAAASGAECALAISGIAGPSGGVPGKPVGTVCFGWQVGGRADAATCHFPGNRRQVRLRAIRQGLQGLLKRLAI